MGAPAADKEALEVRLSKLVCAGEIELADAWAAIVLY